MAGGHKYGEGESETQMLQGGSPHWVRTCYVLEITIELPWVAAQGLFHDCSLWIGSVRLPWKGGHLQVLDQAIFDTVLGTRRGQCTGPKFPKGI